MLSNTQDQGSDPYPTHRQSYCPEEDKTSVQDQEEPEVYNGRKFLEFLVLN